MKTVKARLTLEDSGKNPESKIEKLENLELLVNELLKEKPDEAQVRLFMKTTGLPYCGNSLERLNQVISALENFRIGYLKKDEDYGQDL